MSEQAGCGSSSCIISRPKGLVNNGPCRCADWRGQREITRLRAEAARYKELADDLAWLLSEAKHQITELCTTYDNPTPKDSFSRYSAALAKYDAMKREE